MAYDALKPADNQYIADGPTDVRNNDEALRTGRIVDAGTLAGLSAGNATGNIPVSNGVVNVNLNAEKLGGQTGAYYAPNSHVGTGGTSHADAVAGGASGFVTGTQIAKLNSIEASADVTDAGNVGGVAHAATGKTSPVDDDSFPITDSAASNVLKKVTFANLKAFLKNYFDGLYTNYTHPEVDGSYHVPATLTTNNLKVLKAGATAGVFAWGVVAGSEVSNVASGGIVATTVQSAINELDTDKAPVASPTFTGTVTLPSTTSIGTASSTEIGYLDGVTSSIQTQLNDKAPVASPTFTGTATSPAFATTVADTATAAASYFVEVGTDGVIRPKTLANVKTEIVTTAAIQSAMAVIGDASGIRITVGATAPASPVTLKDIWFDTTSGLVIKAYVGTAWISNNAVYT